MEGSIARPHGLESKAEKFLCSLVIMGQDVTSPKEDRLIDALDRMLSCVEAGIIFKRHDYDYAMSKISRVSCFARKYYPIIIFLDDYLKAYKKTYSQ